MQGKFLRLENHFLKNYLRCFTNVHVQGKKSNIFILSSPRSGSTWLMELIGSEKNLKSCNEPFNIRKDHIASRLNINDWGELNSFASLSTIEKYLNSFILGKHKFAFKNQRPYQKNYNFFTNRMLFKILHACEHQVSWLKDTFNAKIIYLIRHPIPVSISRTEFPRLNAFVNSEYSKCFTDDQLSYSRNIISNGTVLEKAQLDWCLQNSPILNSLKDIDILVTYEQLVMEPYPIINNLVSILDLNNAMQMTSKINIPSGSVTKSNSETKKLLGEQSDDKSMLVRKWQNKITEEEERHLCRC